MAARAKDMACTYGYDCDVPTPTPANTNGPDSLLGVFGYPLVACVRMQNQGLYIREWLEFHIAAGVGELPSYRRGMLGVYRVASAQSAVRVTPCLLSTIAITGLNLYHRALLTLWRLAMSANGHSQVLCPSG